MRPTINVTVNGEPVILNTGSTVGDLLTKLNVSHAAVAIEINAEIVPNQQIASRKINDGEVVEVVSLVGGG